MKRQLFVAALGLVALAGCHKRHEDGPAQADNMMVGNLSSPLPEPTLPPPLPTNTVNTTAAVAPPPTVSEDAQVQEDADAVGMTARSRPSEATGAAANQSGGLN